MSSPYLVRPKGHLDALACVITLTCLLSIPALAAQQPPPDQTPTSSAVEQASVEPTPQLASPRATMRTFLEAFPNRDWEAAISTLDLSDFDVDVAKLRGRELATQLKDVLDRIAYVSLEDIPIDPQGERYVWQSIDGLEVALERSELGWLFSSDTLNNLSSLLASVAHQELVAGVTEAPRTPGMWIQERVPQALRGGSFLFAYWQWLGLVILGLLGWLVRGLFNLILRPLVLRRLAVISDETGQSDQERREVRKLVKRLLQPIGLLVMAVFWWLGLSLLGLSPKQLGTLLIAVRFVGIAALVWAAYRLIDLVAYRFANRAESTSSKSDDLLVPLLERFAKVLIAAFGIVFLADNSGFDITSLLTGLGIGGIALALAAKDTVENLFGSITVLLDRPFEVGDRVVTGSIDGTVEEVGLRSTRIRTAENSLVSLPNANLINAAVDNFGAREFRRWRTTIGLTYDTPPDKIEEFCEGLRELVRNNSHTRDDDVFYIYLNSFGASSLDVLFQIYFTCPDWQTELQERHNLSLDILRLARTQGVEIAFPTQTLHLLHEPPAPETDR